MNDAGDLRAALTAAEQRLADAGVASPQHDARELLAWVLGVQRRDLHNHRSLDSQSSRAFHDAVRRRAAREPLQHITGRAPFRHLDLDVEPGVFVPRPETEVVVEAVLAELAHAVDAGVAHPVVVDLGTGSGAIAVAVATEFPAARVFACEKSPVAAACATRNAARYHAAVDVRLGDMNDAVDDLAGTVHVVVANPPYIPLEGEDRPVQPEVIDHEPPEALWSGAHGLDAIRVVCEVGSRLLVETGLAVCEHHESQGTSAPRLWVEAGWWADVVDHPDLTGRARFLTARRRVRPGAIPRAGTMAL